MSGALRLAEIVLLAAAAASVGVTVAAFAGEASWLLDLTTHFRWQYVAVQVLLLPALLALRRRRFAAATAAALVLNLAALGPYLPRFATAAAARDEALGVLVVNLLWENEDAAALLETVAREPHDVLVLTEFTHDWAARLAPLEERYPYRVEEPRGDAWGIALLSRLPLADAGVVDLEGMPAVDARVVAPAGTFRLLGVHLRPPTRPQWARQRNRQLATLGRWAADAAEPLVVAGDFNSTPYSPHFAAMLEAGGLRTTGAGRGFHFTWPSFLPLLGIPIDHCAVSGEFTVLEHRRLAPVGSDHYPLLARLALAERR
ncbi:MAG TPA: endonuclease/exonuclease/phosphatase family protein [Gammaproteobacteria bacterium]